MGRSCAITASNVLTGFDTAYMRNGQASMFNLMVAEDGGIGLSEDFSSQLMLWSREESDEEWVLSRVIDLEILLPAGALMDAEHEVVVKKVCDNRGFCNLIPVVSFYTPVDCLEYQDLLPSAPREEVGDDEEKTVDEAQQLLDKGSDTIKEGRFINAFELVSHDLDIMVWARKVQEVNDSLDDVPRSASNEESVKGTASKDDAEDSKTSDSNGEDAAPSSEKGDSQEG
ncbi:hypothetical protein ZWY2020_018891 [Hordeum vulgare]|nr:hypothetical protein ZWY2020_018891 [Hordeum vulgare]